MPAPNASLTLSPLLPISLARISTGFTTASSLTHARIAHVALDDSALGVHKVWKGARLTHSPAPSPPSQSASGRADSVWQATYPKGSLNPGNKTAPPGGASFYLSGPPAFKKALQGAAARPEEVQEVVMAYEVMFEDGWDWVLGGKLPGMYGGSGDSAYGCSGGRQDDRCRCFNFRLMWRQQGDLEVYAYTPPLPANLEVLLAVPPKSIEHSDYGVSVGRGAARFKAGKWHVVSERVKIGRVGRAEGELIELYIDGKSVLCAKKLVLRTPEGHDGRVQGMHFSTFFGGNAPEWAPQKDQRAWFASITGAVLRPESSDEPDDDGVPARAEL
ncbi:polysaccharide lyase family 14 protein [Gelatoporia subvermispora B]|uniref:Polysaccharide lyase family 14 protein n=1 Tax=Ceriporiopsis subvermispora (strain B) TaxID=914234 RepID=M2Q7T0_CERS8|nr:polysaccharide lyase family 14 protein [Gelatoporia subvermispora B]